jgi:hypothetical protein
MAKDKNTYSIMDLDGYAVSLREAAAQSFSEDYDENLDDFITLDQTKNIIIGYSLGQDDDGNYLINEEVFNDTFEDIRSWIYEAGIAKLAAQGLVECAWDSDLDQMVFWCKDDEKKPNPTNNGN